MRKTHTRAGSGWQYWAFGQCAQGVESAKAHGSKPRQGPLRPVIPSLGERAEPHGLANGQRRTGRSALAKEPGWLGFPGAASLHWAPQWQLNLNVSPAGVEAPLAKRGHQAVGPAGPDGRPATAERLNVCVGCIVLWKGDPRDSPAPQRGARSVQTGLSDPSRPCHPSHGRR